MKKAEELNEKEEKVLAELDELKRIGGWHKNRIAILKKYAQQVNKEEMRIAYKAGIESFEFGILSGKYHEENFEEWWQQKQELRKGWEDLKDSGFDKKWKNKNE